MGEFFAPPLTKHLNTFIIKNIMGLFDKWREKRRREKAAKKGQSSNLWEKLFKKRRAKKKERSIFDGAGW